MDILAFLGAGFCIGIASLAFAMKYAPAGALLLGVGVYLFGMGVRTVSINNSEVIVEAIKAIPG